jgi:manganese transport protein
LVETLHIGPSLHQSVNGLVPRLAGNNSIVLSAGIVGATVMPHAIYAHSALSASSAERKDGGSILTRIRGARLDVILALGVAGVVNVAMVAMAARLFPTLASTSAGTTLAGIQEGFLVRAGGLSALIFSIALLLSGVAASTVGSFAGQVIADGFLHMRSSVLVRRLATMIPAVALLASGVNATEALVLSQVVLSFGILPAVIPLVMLTRSTVIMGQQASRTLERAFGVGTVVAIFGLNAYLIANSLGS